MKSAPKLKDKILSENNNIFNSKVDTYGTPCDSYKEKSFSSQSIKKLNISENMSLKSSLNMGYVRKCNPKK